MSRYPRVTIEFCTQCRWMLRAAYFAQELLSTFSTALGEVALQPATGGRFVVTLTTSSEEIIIWDRKEKGGFPETKVLKQLVRDIIQPDRDLGHSDKKGHKTKESEKTNGSYVDNGPQTTEPVQEVKQATSENAASQFREVAEQACEDCQ